MGITDTDLSRCSVLWAEGENSNMKPGMYLWRMNTAILIIRKCNDPYYATEGEKDKNE